MSFGGAWGNDVDTTPKKKRIMIDWALIVAFVCHVERNQKPSTICYFAYRSFYCMINLDFTRQAIFGSDFKLEQKTDLFRWWVKFILSLTSYLKSSRYFQFRYEPDFLKSKLCMKKHNIKTVSHDLHWVEINQDVRFTYVNWQGKFITKVQQHVLSPVKKLTSFSFFEFIL